nr:MAG TPA: hypothetical protein [Bacteriophage sp.]
MIKFTNPNNHPIIEQKISNQTPPSKIFLL